MGGITGLIALWKFIGAIGPILSILTKLFSHAKTKAMVEHLEVAFKDREAVTAKEVSQEVLRFEAQQKGSS